jgi:hypothetical protein
MLEIAHCLDSRITDGGKDVSLTRRLRFTPRNIPVAKWLKHSATSRRVACARPDEVNYFFLIYLILPAALNSGVHSACKK